MPTAERLDDRSIDTAVTALLFTSGAAALIDEHVLSKLLARVVGSSAEAVACVLVAFMGGMGLGAALVGRRLERGQAPARPFLRYAAVEAAIAIAAIAVPPVLSALAWAYAAIATDASVGLTAIRFAVAAVVVALPAVLMGATLPLVLDGAARSRATTALPLARWYASNTLGAAAGVLASTYLLIPGLGLYTTIIVAAFGNILAATIAALLARARGPILATVGAERPAEAPPAAEAKTVLPFRRALAIAAGSGLLAFAYEVVGFRLLAVVVGNSVYAFGLMLFVFLLGNGIGSRAAERVKEPRPILLVVVQALVGLATLLTIPLWDDMSPLFQRVGSLAPSFVLWEATRLFVAILLLGPSTLVMGAAFGFLLRMAGGATEAASARTAKLYAFNMAGAITGVLMTTFVVVPSFGSRATLGAISVGEVALGCAALVPAVGPRRRRLAIGGSLAAAAALLLLLAPAWNVATLMSGSNVYFSEGFRDYDRLRRLEEDRGGGMVAVVETQNVKTLLANGKFEGNDGFEVADQYMFALFPELFVRGHANAINIGVGTAASAGAMGSFPFEHIDVVDISRAVIDAARTEFRSLNGGILEDPRVTVHIDDGRNFLLRTTRKYDLVIMQLSSIWIGGTADLYNVEFYDLVLRALAPEGVFQQWLPLNHMQTIDMARIIATMRARFGSVQLWVAGHQGVLVASPAKLVADAPSIAAWPSNPKIKRVMDLAQVDHPYAAFGHYQLGGAALDAFVAEIAGREKPEDLLSTDDNVLLEYSTPRGNLLATALEDNQALVRRHAEPNILPLVRGLTDDTERRVFLAYAARERGFRRMPLHLLRPVLDSLRGGPHHKLVADVDETAKREQFWP